MGVGGEPHQRRNPRAPQCASAGRGSFGGTSGWNVVRGCRAQRTGVRCGEVVAVGGRVAGFAMIGMAGVEVARVAMRGMTWGEVGVQVEAGGSTDMEVCSGRDVAVVDEMSASNNMSRNVELFGLPVS